MGNLQQRVELMVRLGEYLLQQPDTWQAAVELANRHNAWFTSDYCNHAARQIGKYFLSADRLNEWLSQYPDLSHHSGTPKRVGLVMAGNIPLVGFHDFLCIYLSGHSLAIKLSSKDTILWTHLLGLLSNWDAGFTTQVQVMENLKGCEAYIATGSNNTARYFEQYFSKYPHIIRRNRTSVAILDGQESPEELQALADDIGQYFGLGCRNVTKVFVPEHYDFQHLLNALAPYDHHMDLHKYKNNYDYQLTLLLLNKSVYMTNGSILLAKNDQVLAPVSVLNYESYSNNKDLGNALQEDDQIQCIIGHGYLDFGESQQPRLSDYADGVDTMSFLTAL